MANRQRTVLTRRRFVASLAASASFAGVTLPNIAHAIVRPITTAQLRWLQASLPIEDQKFDPFAKMLVASAASASGYHTSITSGDIHPILPSLNYAAALIDTGDSARVERANQIFRVVIGLQDKDSTSKTHGLWPWYLEEPLAKMPAPDFDWADFCAMPLLMCWMLNRDRLARDLVEPLRTSIVHATRSIQQRNLNPAHTHVAILGTAVTLLAAQELRIPELRSYAKDRLRRLHAHIVQQDSFAEYNSPSHSITVLQELSRLLWLLKDSRDVAVVTELHERAWKHVADHFHPPTGQWAGPHSHSRETDLRKNPAALAFLQSASGHRLKFALPEPLPLTLDSYRIPAECPRKLLRLFSQLQTPRQIIETFITRDASAAGSTNSVTGTTWLHPHFTLGTVNRGDFQTNRRPFVAYWGTPAATRFLRLRFLKDGFDFASALIFSAQHQGAALLATTLCTDGGHEPHLTGPISSGTITTKDLRLRIELGGDLADCTVRTLGTDKRSIVIQDQSIRFVIRPLAGSFDGAEVRWAFPDLGLAKSVDIVLHSGEEKSLDLAKLSEAFVCFTFEDWPYEQRELQPANAEFRTNAGRLQARWQTRGRTLDLDTPVKPAPYNSMNDALRTTVV